MQFICQLLIDDGIDSLKCFLRCFGSIPLHCCIGIGIFALFSFYKRFKGGIMLLKIVICNINITF